MFNCMTKTRQLMVIYALLMALTQVNVVFAKDIVVLPSKVKLSGPEASQFLIVHFVDQENVLGPVNAQVAFQSSDLKVVKVENNIAIPLSNGKATITATVGEKSNTVHVQVSGVEEPFDWSFRNHVQSVLTKYGCNSGACHGAAAGKNGFRLSLRGYDPEFDFNAITRHARGRRVVPSDPARSLLLTKPTGTVPHKGGIKFDSKSKEYRVLAEWIASGQPAPKKNDARIQQLEVLPKQASLKPGMTEQIVVLAHFNDGHVEEVTPWVKFSSSNESVAQVDQLGKVSVTGSGEGAITAWYLAQNAIATVTVPFENKISAKLFNDAEKANFIDELILQKLQQLNIPPSPQSSDSEFLRRVYLDTIGTLPTEKEVRTFLSDDSGDKRAKMIDQLLERSEFVDYWAYRWSDLLLVTGERLRPQAVQAYYNWVRKNVEKNTPWDEFARQVMLARGSSLKNGAVNFYALHQDPLAMAETTSMAFLGMSINCARCHDHPLEKWTNDDYYGMASLFARVRSKGWGGDFRSGDGNRTVFLADSGEVIQPRIADPQKPRPLDGVAIDFNYNGDRREVLADWLTSPENPYFTKAIVNRVWANYMGVGIVENVDDLRLTNPPSNPELFDRLAAFLIENDYNLKELMRLILNSKTYQRTSKPVRGNESETRFYSRYYPRRLKAEVLLDAFSLATNVPTDFKKSKQSGGGRIDVKIEKGTRAIQLADSSIVSYFLETFGRPERLNTCECERSDEPSMTQVLHIMNGGTLNQKLMASNCRPKESLNANKALYRVVEEAYLVSLSRFPSNREMSELLAILNDAKDPKEKSVVVEDLYWSLLSSKEFLFNH